MGESTAKSLQKSQLMFCRFFFPKGSKKSFLSFSFLHVLNFILRVSERREGVPSIKSSLRFSI